MTAVIGGYVDGECLIYSAFQYELNHYESGELMLSFTLCASLLFICVEHGTHSETCLLEVVLCAIVHNLREGLHCHCLTRHIASGQKC